MPEIDPKRATLLIAGDVGDVPEGMRRVAVGAFEAGWAAALLSLADLLESAAGAPPDMVAPIRRMAAQPPPVDVGTGKPPEGSSLVMARNFATKAGGS